jgi:hypothetical protein
MLPVSSGAFQVRPKSLRFIFVVAEIAIRVLPQGSFVAGLGPLTAKRYPAGVHQIMCLSIPAIAHRSSGHQNREARLIQDRPCDPAKQPLVECGVTIGAHDKEIGAKGGCLRQQEVTHLLSCG